MSEGEAAGAFDPSVPIPGEPGAVLNHVGHCVVDLERSVAFYEALGFVVDRELELPDEHVAPVLGVPAPFRFRAAYLRLGDFVLELMHFGGAATPERPPRELHEPGLTHLSISVLDLDAAVAAVAALGGTVGLTTSRVAMIRDPDGQVLELLPMSYRRRLDHETLRPDPVR